MASDVWSIRLLGGFRVESPSGHEISIASRKAKALVALLALNDGIAISRESLGSYLWPDKPKESQQQNLRQAVKDVRRAFEPVEALLATRVVCCLSLENFTCDAAECLRSGKDAGTLSLLPEMPEPVFDSYRDELASYAPTGELGEVVRSASAVLEWTLASEPSRVIEMLHACRDLIPSLPLPQLEGSLRKGLELISSGDPLRGWAVAQFALVLMWAGRYEEGLATAKTEMKEFRPDTDPYTWANVACSAGVALILRGRFEAAGKFLDGAIAIAKSNHIQGVVNLFEHGHALRLFYMGDFDGALAAFATFEPTPLSEVHYSLGLSLVGRIAEAREKLDIAKSQVNEESRQTFWAQVRLAEAGILLAEAKKEEARAILEPLVQFCESHGLRLVAIHALEGLALLESDPVEARVLIKQAIAKRERYSMPLLPGDHIRLARVLK